ncbi:hypothetical protein ACV3UL_08570 [Clostridium perfringens]
MNLNKRAMQYAKLNNYYKLSKIKKYLVLFDKRLYDLKINLKPSICPNCGNQHTFIDYDDSEYSYEAFMYCNSCGECYKDDAYIDKCEELECFNYFDGIEIAVWARGHVPGNGYTWFKECDEEMTRMIDELSQFQG